MKDHDRGAVLIFAVFLLTLFCLLGFALVDLSLREYKMIQVRAERMKAYYAAESGWEKACSLLQNDPGLLLTASINQSLLDEEDPLFGAEDPVYKLSCGPVTLNSCTVSDGMIMAVFAVTGRCNNTAVNLKIKASVNLENGLVDVLNWKT